MNTLKNTKSALKKCSLYIAFYTFFVTLYILMSLIGFQINLYSNIDVYFYRGCSVIITVFFIHILLSLLFVLWIKRKYIFSFANGFCVSACCCSLMLGFFGVIPVSLDRSISVFLLGYIYNENRPLSKEELTESFLNIYMDKYQAMERRFEEQTVSGNIFIDENGKINLTKQGKLFIEKSKTLGDLFRTDTKFLFPQRILINNLNK